MKKIIALSIFFCFLLFSFSSAQAIVQKTGENISLNLNEIIDDDFFVSGQTIEINGLIKGDLFVFGQNIVINGNVEGDIIGAGQQIAINGNVNGNIRIFGQIVKFNNQTDKNINIFGQNIFFSEKSKIGKNLLIFGENIEANGKIDGYIFGNGKNVVFAGENNKDIFLNTESLVLQAKTIIKGDLTYVSPQKIVLQPGAQILGKTVYKIPTFEKEGKKYSVVFFFWKLVSLFGFLIIGLIFISLFPKKTLEIINQIKKTPWKNLAYGIISFIVMPIISLFLIAMLIGIPLAFMGMCLYFILLYLAQLFVGLTIGVGIDKKIRKPKEEIVNQEQTNNLIWPMILGMTFLIILFNIPYFGWVLKLIIIWLGLGGIIKSIKIKNQN